LKCRTHIVGFSIRKKPFIFKFPEGLKYQEILQKNTFKVFKLLFSGIG